MPVQSTEHSCCVAPTKASRGRRQPLPFAGSGVPDNKEKAHVAGGSKENATMAAVDDAPAAGAAIERLLGERGGCGSGEEARYNAVVAVTTGVAPAVVEESEQGRRSLVEGEVAAAEGGVAEEAAPGFAGEGGAHEACRVFRRDA